MREQVWANPHHEGDEDTEVDDHGYAHHEAREYRASAEICGVFAHNAPPVVLWKPEWSGREKAASDLTEIGGYERPWETTRSYPTSG